jgi:alkylhydroperoxidase family enzyme
VTALPLVPADSDDPDLAAVFDRFRTAGRDVPVLYRVLGNSPAMLQAWTAMAWPLREAARTPRGLRELVIMRVAQLTDAAYEWVAHGAMALHCGLTLEQLAALRDWQDSDQFDADQRLLLLVTDELTLRLDITESTFTQLTARYGPPEVVELVLTVAFYSCVSRTLRALRVGPVEDSDGLLDLM